ncbi:MAG TPA: PilW family protein [Malonomonas sp.]
MSACRTLGQKGMTLVELMVAMVISLVLLGGVYQIFTGSTNSNRENEQFARLQENARFAMEIIGRDLRMAGYSGCAAVDTTDPARFVNTLNNAGDYLFNFSIGMQGFDYIDPLDGDVVAADFSPVLDASIPLANLVELSDILTVRKADTANAVLLEDKNPAGSTSWSADLKVTDGTPTSQIDTNDILMISDCVNAAVFQVTNYTMTNGNTVHNSGGAPPLGDPAYPGNSTKDLGHNFQPGSEIVKFTTETYLIRNNAAGVPSLFRIDSDSVDELVEGVESMQIRYGIDNNNDRQVDAYVTATAAAADWTQVVSVRVALLLQSDINARLPVDNNVYDLDGDGAGDYGPIGDRRMRRVFKATVALRNRVS